MPVLLHRLSAEVKAVEEGDQHANGSLVRYVRGFFVMCMRFTYIDFFILIPPVCLILRLLYLTWAIASNTNTYTASTHAKESSQSQATGRQLLWRYDVYERVLSPVLRMQRASLLHKTIALKIVHALLDLRYVVNE
jgi:hypothetical protein